MRDIVIKAEILNAPSAGLELAAAVSQSISRGDPVRLDFARYDRATPSFANAFMMTLLHQFDRELLRSNVRIDNACPAIVEALNASISRYDRGIRLSIQRTPAAG